jgi:hypothetical protein
VQLMVASVQAGDAAEVDHGGRIGPGQGQAVSRVHPIG